MEAQSVNRITWRVLLLLSLTALLTVLSGFTHPPQPPEPDEGAAAHIFQLAIVASVPVGLLFLGRNGVVTTGRHDGTEEKRGKNRANARCRSGHPLLLCMPTGQGSTL